MEVSSIVDWIEITRPDYRCAPQDFVPRGDQWKIEEVLDPIKHYDWCGRCANGALVLHGATQRQGMRMVVSGEPMRRYRASGYEEMELIKFAHTDDRKVTRLDLTIDMVGNDAPHPELFSAAIDSGEIVTRARHFEIDKLNLDDGYTQYIGSKSSDKRMRIYDYRAKHLNVLWDAWTRVELQQNQDYARAAAQDCMRHGIRSAACNHVKNFIDFPLIDEYQIATDAGLKFPPKKVPRKVTNWEKWILETVVASCEKAIGTSRQTTIEELHRELSAMLGKTCT